ncbi:MAG: TRAP transporter fused permease subunit [Pseudomonadota bacterium]
MSDKQAKSPAASSGLYRNLDGWSGRLTRMTFIAMPLVGCFFVMDIPFYFEWAILREQYYGLILAMILPCTFILVPMTKTAPRDRIPWYDLILALLGVVIGLYIAIFYQQIALSLGTITPDRVILGTIGLALIVEASRRVTNWILAGFGLLFILFPHFAWMLSDFFSGMNIPFPQQVNYLFLETNGMLSMIFGVAAIIVLAFVLFGNLMFSIGGGAFITDIAMACFGRYRGGPAKIAVVASTLFGTISGVVVANVATTGVVTIPLMKKIGYKPHLAGAIESVASTGGQLCPPIMGVTAFVMAELLGVPYRQVAIAALIPALLYYAAIFFQVDMEAGKGGMKGLPQEQLPKIAGVLNKSYLFIIPFGALIAALFLLYLSPEKSALVGVLSILVVGLLIQKETRFRLGWILEGLSQTGRALLLICPIAAMAGIVVGTISYTGVGFLVSLNLAKVAGGNIFVLMPIIALACFILGMGMPTLPAYIVLAVLMGPVMVELGVVPMAAHMFILYYAGLSMITPPVCIAAYAGAAIAGSEPMRTGLAAARLGIISYIVPFLFVFFPALLFIGSWGEILVAFATAMSGCFVLSAALVGYLFSRLGPIKRILFGLAGLALLIPIRSHADVLSLSINIGGFGVAFLLTLSEWNRRRER